MILMVLQKKKINCPKMQTSEWYLLTAAIKGSDLISKSFSFIDCCHVRLSTKMYQKI